MKLEAHGYKVCLFYVIKHSFNSDEENSPLFISIHCPNLLLCYLHILCARFITPMWFPWFNSIHGQHRTSGLLCDTSTPLSVTLNNLRTFRPICLENTCRFRNLHVSYAGSDSSENVIINGKVNPSNAVQADAVALGTIAADMAPVVDGFSADDDELDLDLPTEGFSSIPEAIEDIRQGKVLPLCQNCV